MKKILILSALSLLPLCAFLPEQAIGATSSTKTLQMVQILSREITVLKNLMANLGNALDQSSPPLVSASSYLAFDLSNNATITEKDSTMSHPIASVTKLMNAVVVLENVNLNKKITLSSNMLSADGGSPALYKGLKISSGDLLKAALTQSVNDAANSLSYFLGRDQFIAKMNEKAQALGMTSTVFFDPTGLNPHNVSTTADLLRLISYIYKNHPEILTMTKDNNFWLPTKTGKLVKFYNENYFYYLSRFIGGKTGYLPEANQTLVSLFSAKGRVVAIILLDSKNPVSDTFQILTDIEKNF